MRSTPMPMSEATMRPPAPSAKQHSRAKTYWAPSSTHSQSLAHQHPRRPCTLSFVLCATSCADTRSHVSSESSIRHILSPRAFPRLILPSLRDARALPLSFATETRTAEPLIVRARSELHQRIIPAGYLMKGWIRPLRAMRLPNSVLMNASSGMMPTRPRSRRSASQQVPMVGSG